MTTNYDPCLYEAQCDQCPTQRRVPCTWSDESEIDAWHTRDIEEDGSCPILFEHGIWNKPESIILDSDSYRKAYKDGPYLRLFKELWHSRHLVLIGVGFSDTWVDRVLDDILTYVGCSAGTRHVAILGLRDEDSEHVTAYRDLMQNAYNSQVLFYRVEKRAADDGMIEDHNQLLTLLQRVREQIKPPSLEDALGNDEDAKRFADVAGRSRTPTADERFKFSKTAADGEQFLADIGRDLTVRPREGSP